MNSHRPRYFTPHAQRGIANTLSPGLELSNPVRDRPLFLATCLLLAAYFYQIPVLRTPWGMLTWLKVDDFAFVVLVLAAIGSTPLPPGITRTFIGRLLIVMLCLAPLNILITFVTTPHPQALLRGLWTAAKFVQFFIVFAVVSRLRMNPYRLRVLLTIALLGSGINGLVGIAQYFGWMDPARLYRVYLLDPHFLGTASFVGQVAAGEWGRALGLFSANYVLMGMFMCVGVGLVLVAFAAPLGAKLKLLAAAVFVPVTAGLTLSGSRTAMLMAVALALVYGVLAKRRPVILLVVFLLVLTSLRFLTVAEGIVERWEGGLAEWQLGIETVGGGRLWLYKTAIIYFMTNPTKLLLGIGMAAWYYKLFPIFGYNNPHSMYILVLAEYGLPGFIVWVILQVAVLRFLWRVGRRAPDPLVAGWARGMTSIYIALLAGCFFYELLQVTPSFGSFLGYLQVWLGVTYALGRDSATAASVTRSGMVLAGRAAAAPVSPSASYRLRRNHARTARSIALRRTNPRAG